MEGDESLGGNRVVGRGIGIGRKRRRPGLRDGGKEKFPPGTTRPD